MPTERPHAELRRRTLSARTRRPGPRSQQRRTSTRPEHPVLSKPLSLAAGPGIAQPNRTRRPEGQQRQAHRDTSKANRPTLGPKRPWIQQHASAASRSRLGWSSWPKLRYRQVHARSGQRREYGCADRPPSSKDCRRRQNQPLIRIFELIRPIKDDYGIVHRQRIPATVRLVGGTQRKAVSHLRACGLISLAARTQ